MSDNDKTRQKLVDSMRRTKVSATKKAEPQAKSEVKKAPASKPAAAKKPSIQKAQAKKSSTVAAKSVTADAYQSGRRIWPD